MVEMSKPDDQSAVEMAIEDFEGPEINRTLINVTRLLEMVEDSCDSDYADFPMTSRLRKILISLGYKPAGRFRIGADKCRFYTTKTMTKEQIDKFISDWS
jgi:hypothetical protein